MKTIFWKVTALCLAASLLLSGCAFFSLESLLTVPFVDMEYQRPDVTALEQAMEDCRQSAPGATDAAALMDKVWVFYDAYNLFYANYFLAYIHYSKDLTDIYWEQEYNYCLEKTAVVDGAFDQLCYALAACPLREELEAEEYFGEGYFDSYEGESIWDETFTDLMEQEAALISRYYDLNEQSANEEYYSDAFFRTYGAQMGDLFVELVALRQQIAEYAGYEDYPSFAFDFYYYRDYTPEQATAYLDEIRQELVPMYRQMDMDDVWRVSGQYSSEADTFAYVKAAAKAMGGTVESAFNLMDRADLYDISYSENKYDASFEVFIPYYYEPYVFVNPTLTAYDKLNFAHEFGHFCNDYASGGSAAGVDVAEIFSQGMEYLSLCYTDEGEKLTKFKMATCLTTYVEQAMYASFEQQVYALEGEELTAENVYALYRQTGLSFGFDSWAWDSRDFVVVSHFFTSPLYVLSYVVSNDAALQLYQLEQEEAGSGLTLFEESLTTTHSCFLAFLESAGLESPFAEGRLADVRKTLEEALK